MEIAYQFCTILKSVKKPTTWLPKSSNKFLEKCHKESEKLSDNLGDIYM